MTIRTIDDAVLHSPEVTAYLKGTERRIILGFRAALELLNLPVPNAADRKPVGRPPAADAMRLLR